MTIGEKIAHLRIVNNISQEHLASILNVSRQSVSKWESDESIPQLDKVLEICKIFDIKTDELLKNEIILHKGQRVKLPKNAGAKTKYFGTDGFRGEVNKDLTVYHAFKIGRFLGWFYSNPKFSLQKDGYRPRVVIGKDTRKSSYMLEYALASGLASSGADVCLLHVTTTPSVSFITRKDGFDCGVMITASHNPFYDNGIKILNCNGEKLDDSIALLIEAYIDGDMETLGIDGDDIPFKTRGDIGTINDYSSGRNRYIAYLISLAVHSFKKLRIGLDTANGASWMIAKSVFEALGAEVHIINNQPDGLNINLNAGSTHIDILAKFVKENHLDVGFAFDGDADRCLAVDEKGNIVDGDKIIYLLSAKLLHEGALSGNTVVTTIMSNTGLTKALDCLGIKNIQTQVGDRFVYERMTKENYALGGEQSGHVIIKKYATTGDGILTALMVTEQIIESKSTLSKLVAPVKLLPQVLKNVRVTDKNTAMNDEKILAKFAEVNKRIGGNGRAILRSSGTEPLVRIMVECPTTEECNGYIDEIYTVIKKRGYVCE